MLPEPALQTRECTRPSQYLGAVYLGAGSHDAANGGGAQSALDSVDAMWARSQPREPSQPAADPAEGAAASMTSPPPAGASREEVRAYREALRATAVQNIRRTQAEVAEAMTRVTDEQSQGLDR